MEQTRSCSLLIRPRQVAAGCSALLRVMQALDEHPSLKLVRLLRREYGTALGRDPALGAMLDAIEELYFGVQRQQGGFGNVLGDIMQMLAAPG